MIEAGSCLQHLQSRVRSRLQLQHFAELLERPRLRCTVADLALYAYTHVADEGGFDLGPFPRIRAWLDRVADRPGFTPITQR